MTENVLERLCRRRLDDVRKAMQQRPLDVLQSEATAIIRRPIALTETIRHKCGAGQRAFITEIKRASPSAGMIHPDVDVAGTAQAYIEGGAVAISILTEPHEFFGSDDDLCTVRRNHPDVPLLRKDFTVDPYQIWEARVLGADVVLLLVNVLGARTQALLDCAREAGLQALLEVHNAEELALALDTDAELIGVNARNLKTFETRIEWVEELIGQVPDNRVAIAESGIKMLADIERLESAGAQAYLIGETLMRSEDPRGILKSWRAS